MRFQASNLRRDRPPTCVPGHCYRGAFVLLEYLEVDRGERGWVLVHGYPRLRAGGPWLGRLYGHAWVQHGERDLVLDPYTPRVEVPTQLYYSVGRVEHSHRWTLSDARREACEHSCWGPWYDLPEGVGEPVFREDIEVDLAAPARVRGGG